MNKIKITRSITPSTEEIEIELPYYTKSKDIDCFWFKIIAQDCVIQVALGFNGTSIQHLRHLCGALDNDTIECTEEAFLAAYNEAKGQLEILINE